MTKVENFIHIDPNKQERKVPDLNGQKPINYRNAKHLEKKHQSEKNKTFINYQEKKKHIFGETKEHLNKEQLIHRAKVGIYEEIGIDNKLNKNNPVQNFAKGVIDELIIGNYELAIEIVNTNGAVLLDALNQLMSVEGMKAIAKGLEESAVKLASGNAYEKGRSFIELGLTGLGATAGLKIAKFGIKKLKHIDVPKHNFDKLSVSDIAKMSDPDKLEAANHFLNRTLNKQEQEAIIKAHKIGENREGAGIHNYSFSEKAEKLKILEKAGFSKEERKLLLKKGVCGKVPEVNIDRLEMKGTYELDKIKGLSPINATKKIEEFAKVLDAKYLVRNPEKIDSMLDIVESMCNYVDKNHGLIMRLDKNKLEDFRMSFNDMRKNIIKLENEMSLKSFKNDIVEIKNNRLNPIMSKMISK